MKTVDVALIKTIYTKRKENTHKGDHGHALLIAGSANKMGAALIASKACLRSGVGLLTVSIPKEEKQTLNAFLTFGIAFVARPFGAILFGHFGDKFGHWWGHKEEVRFKMEKGFISLSIFYYS